MGGDSLAPAVFQPVALAADVDHYAMVQQAIKYGGCSIGVSMGILDSHGRRFWPVVEFIS